LFDKCDLEKTSAEWLLMQAPCILYPFVLFELFIGKS